MKKSKSVITKGLVPQKQMFLVTGHLNNAVGSHTSWTFVVFTDNGERACDLARAEARRHGAEFTMELCVYGRGPRAKNSGSSYNRIQPA